MKLRLKYLLLLLSFALLVHACSRSDELPSGILPVDKMSAIMLDLQLAKAYNYAYLPEHSDTVYPKDVKKRLQVFYQQIFELHHTDTATFFSSFRYYSSHPDWLQKVYKTMQDSLENKMNRQRKLISGSRKESNQRRVAEQIQTTLSRYLLRWHSFSDSINRQMSKFTGFVPAKLSSPQPRLRVAP